MERLVTPADCALAVALPLSFAEFVRDVETPDKDFARAVVANSGRSVAAAWQDLYEPKVMALYGRVTSRAASLGATVVPQATSGSLLELFERFHVVSLLAHSRFAAVQAEDVLAPRAILESIAAGELLVAAQLRDIFADIHWVTDEAQLRAQIASALEAALEPSRTWAAATARRDDQIRPLHYMNRVMLEDTFGPALRRAPLLELRDGLRTMDEVMSMIPEDFAGVLDLSVCNSVALGESIKRRRRDCLIVENVFLARVDVRLVLYGLVVGQLARAPARYTEALTEVKRALLKDSP